MFELIRERGDRGASYFSVAATLEAMGFSGKQRQKVFRRLNRVRSLVWHVPPTHDPIQMALHTRIVYAPESGQIN